MKSFARILLPVRAQKAEVKHSFYKANFVVPVFFPFILISVLWPIHVIICLEGKTSFNQGKQTQRIFLLHPFYWLSDVETTMTL